jgi:hypothetical protein
MPSLAAEDAGKGLYGVCRIHSGSQGVGDDIGDAVENGGSAAADPAEADEDFEGSASERNVGESGKLLFQQSFGIIIR